MVFKKKVYKSVKIINESHWKEKIILQSLHVKLDLIKQLVKTLDKNENCLKYIYNLFPELSMTKLKTGISYGPKTYKFIRLQFQKAYK